jgi:UPF0755 protein
MKQRLLTGVTLIALTGCAPSTGEVIEFQVPDGASFSAVSDTLHDRGLVRWTSVFGIYARLREADRAIKAGRYALAKGTTWGAILDALTEGRVVTVPLTIPEGFRLTQMVGPIAQLTGQSEPEITLALQEKGADSVLGVPGPGLEGYLFPDTYRFAPGVSPEVVIRALTDRYRSLWTRRRRARLGSLGMTEREIVTLASIVQAEARHVEEMPRISSVYHNRLELGWLLQADPTVLYALGGPRQRLLFAAIDSVADDPYNTYTQPGLPPGPIGAPGEAAIEAALYPADEDFLYFVARMDGTHTFSRTLAEHNRAVAQARQERARARESPSGSVP